MSELPVLQRLMTRLYGRPLIQNNARGELVEEIVAMALEPQWRLCGGDWGSHDLERVADGLRIQVKQSAAKQSWHGAAAKASRGGFSIASKKGLWTQEGSWIAGTSRNAEIFVFGWHPVTDESADHRLAEQWQFFVVAEQDLPQQSTISLARLRTIAAPVSIPELARSVAIIADARSKGSQ